MGRFRCWLGLHSWVERFEQRACSCGRIEGREKFVSNIKEEIREFDFSPSKLTLSEERRSGEVSRDGRGRRAKKE